MGLHGMIGKTRNKIRICYATGYTLATKLLITATLVMKTERCRKGLPKLMESLVGRVKHDNFAKCEMHVQKDSDCMWSQMSTPAQSQVVFKWLTPRVVKGQR